MFYLMLIVGFCVFLLGAFTVSNVQTTDGSQPNVLEVVAGVASIIIGISIIAYTILINKP